MELLKLLELQEIDLMSDRLKKTRSSLPELEQFKRARAGREAAEEQVRQTESELRALDLETDKKSGELQILETELKEMETRLFSGGMTGRETELMRQGVEERRNGQGKMEEEVLTLLDERDQVRVKLTQVKEDAEQARKVEAELEQLIKTQWGEIDDQLSQCDTETQRLAAEIPAELMELYTELRSTKHGIAIGKLTEDVCGGCNISLSPPEQVESAESDPPRCVHCLRILVI